MAPMEYLIQLRIQKACTLLDTTNQPVARIGSAVGYDDPYYFSRIFHKIMGASPAVTASERNMRRPAYDVICQGPAKLLDALLQLK